MLWVRTAFQGNGSRVSLNFTRPKQVTLPAIGPSKMHSNIGLVIITDYRVVVLYKAGIHEGQHDRISVPNSDRRHLNLRGAFKVVNISGQLNSIVAPRVAD